MNGIHEISAHDLRNILLMAFIHKLFFPSSPVVDGNVSFQLYYYKTLLPTAKTLQTDHCCETFAGDLPQMFIKW